MCVSVCQCCCSSCVPVPTLTRRFFVVQLLFGFSLFAYCFLFTSPHSLPVYTSPLSQHPAHREIDHRVCVCVCCKCKCLNGNIAQAKCNSRVEKPKSQEVCVFEKLQLVGSHGCCFFPLPPPSPRCSISGTIRNAARGG